MTSTEPTLTVCGAAGTVQVVIQNTGGATLTGVSLQAVFPTGISYVGGSVSSVPAGATEIGPGQFALPDILAGQTLQVTFSIQAGCDILPLLGDPNAHIRNTYTLSWAGGGSFTLTSADYTILEPALQYASITNQVYNAPGVGVTFSRVFTVANVGSGALAAFTHRETWGNCVQVVSVTGGQVVSQTVSELILSFGAPDFGPNGLFDPGETVTFTVTYRVVCCTNLSSTFQLRWGCNGQICRTVAATGGVTVPGGTPNLQGQHRWLTESSCYGPAVPAGANRMRLRLWNSGTGPARNIQVVLQGVNGRDALHVPSVAVQFPTGGAVPFVIINQSSHTGCFLGVGGMALSLTLELQADLQPGQEVWIEADGYTCPPPSCNSNSNNIHTELRNFSWRINYQSACGQSYTAQGTSRTRTYYPSPMSLSVPCIPRQGTATLVVQVERGPGIFILTPDGFASSGTPSSSDYAFRWELAMPPCYAIVGQPVWYGPDPANPGNLLAWSGSVVGTSVVFTEATRPANWNNSSFTNSFLHIPLTSACQPPGGTPSCVVFSGAIPPAITVTGYYNPNTTCNAPDWCFSAPRGARILTCPDPTDCNGGIIICPDPNNCPPPFEGIFFADFSFKRVSYGLPDNNQDGLPDPAGGLDFSRIRVQAGMATDTVEAYYEGVIAKPTGGGWPTAWAILGFQPSGGNVTLQPLQLNVRLKKASTGQVYTLQVDGASLASLVQTFPSCQGGSCVTGFEVDLRTSSLQALLPGFPSLYEHGDSLKIWLSARIEQVGTTVEVVASVQPCLYVTDEVSPSPHTSAFSCGIYGENFTFVGHFFDFYQGSNPFISSGCGGAQIELISRFRPKGFTCGGNVFPYEYRPWSFPESLEVELPTGWVYEVGSGQVTFGRTSGVTCTNTSVALDPTNPAGPLLEFPLFTLFPAGGGAWVIADDEYTVRVRFRVRPTCGVPANGSFLRASITHDGRLSYRGRINPFSPNLQMNPPVQLQVQPVVNPIVADQATLTWTLEIRNPSNAIAAPNVFLYLQAGAGQVVVTSVEEVGVGPIPLSNDHYRLGNIAPGVVRRFLIKATLSGCMPDTLWAVVGWDCQGYPVQAAGFPCLDYRVPLSYILQSPNPIMTFSAAPNPHDLCTEVTIETQITNAGTAYFYGALVTLQLPPNLSYVSGSGEVAYPASGVFVPLPNPTPSPGGLIWDLEALVPGLANGWPYQGSGASLRLRYRVASQCGYISGRGVRQVLSYRNVCQQTLYKTAAVPIQLNIPPALAPYSTQISTPDQTVGSCVSTLSVCVTITQQGPGISGVGDQVWVVLPPGFGYVPGSTTGLGNQDPTITQSNGLTYLSWPFPAGVASGQGVNFCFTLTPPASAGSYSLLIQTTAPSMLTCGAGPCQTQIPTGAHTLQVQLLDIQPVLQSTNVLCAGAAQGSITLSFNGPLPPGTTWQWSGPGGFSAGAVQNLTNLVAGTYTLQINAPGCPPITRQVILSEPPPLQLTLLQLIHPLCFGSSNGSIKVEAAGGVGPYEYSIDGGTTWDPTGEFLGLGAGTYTVIAKDAHNCTVSLVVTLQNPPQLVINNPVIVPPSCRDSCDGAITIKGVGGTRPYTYRLARTSPSVYVYPDQADSTFRGLCPGTYTLRIEDANGCVRTRSGIVLPNPPLLSLSLSSSGVSCAGAADGTITATATGGVGPAYSFSIDGGVTFLSNGTNSYTFSGLSGGTYTITVRDANGCRRSGDITVSEPTALALNAPTVVDVRCNGGMDGSITVNVVAGSGTAPYEYSLNGGPYQASATFTGLSAGSYTVTVRDANGCTISQVVTVGQPATALALDPPTVVDVRCNGGSDGSITVNVVAGSGTAPYEYSLNGGPYQASPTFTGLSAGSYTVTVRDANGCTISQVVTVGQPTGLALNAPTVVDVRCNGGSDGSITVNVVAGSGTAPYEYSLNGGPYQASPTFTGLSAGSYTVTVRDANGCTISQVVTVGQPTALALNAPTVVDVRCNGGSDGSITVNVVAGSGTAPYEYSLNGGPYQASPTFTGLSAGSYTVTVRDANGCTISQVVTVGQPTGLALNAPTVVDVRCNGGSDGSITVNVVAGSGTAPYEYSLNGGPYQASPTFTGLSAGSYTVTVRDANGCTISQVVTVGQPTALALNAPTVVDVRCNGGSDGSITVNVVAGSGTAPYEYSLNGGPYQASPTFTGLSAGSYTVTVRDANGCTISQVVTVGQPTGLALNAPTVVDVRCNGGSDGSITVNVVAGSGTAPYEYSLNGGPYQASPTFTGLSAGSYTVTVRDANGCTISQVVTVGQPTALALNAPTVVDVRCNGGMDGSITVNVVAGSGTAPYEYSLNGGPYQASATFTGLSAGSYTVTVRDANGCTISQVVTVGQPATALALDPPTVVDVRCNGGSDGSITVNVVAGSGTAPYEYSLNGGPYQASPTFTGLSAGSYTVTVRDANGCTISQVVTVGQPTGLALNVPTVVDVRCNGGSDGSITVNVVAGSGTAPYEYSLNGGPYQASPTFTGLSAGSYTVTVRDANGCTISQVVTVGQPTALALNAPTVVDVRCNGGSDGSITVNVVAGSGTAPYEYSLNGGPYQASPTFTGLSAGSYTVTVRDANGCTISQVVTVGQPTALALNAPTVVDVRCNGGSDGSITVNVVAGSGTAPYEYSLNGGPYQASPTFTGLSAGSYTVTVRDANGCTISQVVTVGQPTGLALNAPTVVDVRCNGGSDGSITVNVVAGSGTAPYEYSLNGGPYQASPTFTGLSAGSYTVTVRDANGCTISQVVTVGQPTALALNAPTVVDVRCNGGSDGSITVNVVAGSGTAPYEYSLNGGPYQASPTFTGLSAGSYTVTVRDANGCTISQVVTVGQPTALALNAPTVVDVRCNGGSDGSITVNVVAGSGTAPYEYSLNGGPYQASPTFTGLSAGTYTVTIRDANGCTISQTVTVGQPAAPVSFTFTVTNAPCYGGLGTIVFSASGGVGGYEYGVDGVYGSNGTVSVPAGTYVLTVRDANGCVAGAQTAVVGQPQPVVGSVASLTVATCRESSDGGVVLTAQGGTSASGSYTYVWVSHPQYSGANVSGLAPGSYEVVVRDDNGCEDTIRFSVPYRSYVDAALQPVDVSGCVPLGGSWVALPSGVGPYSYEWDMGDGTVLRDSVVQHVYAVQGSYSIRLIVRNGDGCADTAYGVAQAYFTPVASYTIDPDTSVDRVVGTVFTLTSTTQNAQRVWWGIEGYGVHEGPVWQVRFDRPGRYCFKVWAQNGSCVDSASGCIEVKDPYVYLPNAFSPNGDGVNDVFEIKAFGLKESRVRIYDRWGVLVFDNGGDMSRHWDGTYRGSPVPEDAYTVVIEGKLPPFDKPFKRGGTVTLIR